MKLRRSAEKLDDYRERLEKGSAAKIKPKHVDRIIEKLSAKKAKIELEHEEAINVDKKERLQRKLATIGEQIERASWLKEKITEANP